MCGLVGIIRAGSSPEQLADLAVAMADAVAHRGPDSSGVWASPTSPIALAHRRLSIVDLSPHGHQPMYSSCSKGAMVYNGEIYNFKKLRTELERNGATFRGHSDSEVLLATIDTYGFDNALKKIKGMFSIVYWNENSKTLHFARDRIGEKPLYYGHVNNTLIIASELKSIYKVLPANTLSIDQQALNSFLRYGYISAPQTIFKELKKLPPGHSAELVLTGSPMQDREFDSGLSVSPYWQIMDCFNPQEIYEDTDVQGALGDLDGLVNHVIQEQSVADVPLGSFLSGGIDSSLVSSVLQSQSAKPIETFTIGFHEKDFNEAEHAKRIANHIGSSHNELYLGAKDALDLIPSLPKIYDEPFADASQLPTFLVSQFAKSKLTVCLSGDGGDELFAGYNRYIQGENFSRASNRLPAPISSLIAKTALGISPSTYDKAYQCYKKLRSQKGGASFGLKVHKAAAAIGIRDPFHLYQYLCSYSQQPASLLRDNTLNTPLPEILPFQDGFIDAAMAWDQQWYLPGDNLVKSDRASMATSLEMRVPLLDKELIEFAWKIPPTMKVRNGESKWLLRQMLYKYVPRKLIDRPKMGFSVPVSHWIRGELREWAEDLLSIDSLNQQEIFNTAAVRGALDTHTSGKRDLGNMLWTILMFQSWHQTYCT